ncbi:MAG: hypothetical protein ISR65_15685 [Bacteriovoracaceae bacterium]|nr:hypothetical protein [Bacteriovoracaceae bacterium]
MKHKILVMIILLCSPGLTYGADSFLRGKGRFLSVEGDALSFIKKQLLYKAFRNVIDKKLKLHGLDNKLFWQNFDTSFEAYMAPIEINMKERFEEKFGKKYGVKFNKALRLKKLKLKSTFKNITRVISSYSIKKMGRSLQYPNSRYINIIAKVDSKLLNKLYYRLLASPEQNRYFSKMYIQAEFQINNMDWTDLGVEASEDLTSVVKEHWKKWAQENLSMYIGEVIVTDQKIEQLTQNYADLQEKSYFFNDQNSLEEDSNGVDTLWLKVDIKVEKLASNQLLQTRDFAISGGFFLLDFSTSKIVAHDDFKPRVHKYSTLNLHKLSSNVASEMYRLPLLALSPLKTKLGLLPIDLSNTEIFVENMKNIYDTDLLNTLMQTKGAHIRCHTSVVKYNMNQAKINLTYRGSSEDLHKFLLSLDGLKLDDSRRLTFNPDTFSISLEKTAKK